MRSLVPLLTFGLTLLALIPPAHAEDERMIRKVVDGIDADATEPDDSKPAIRLEEIASSDRQWTGVTISATGRVFVNFPRWSDDVPVSVGELTAIGTVRPYPDSSWNQYQIGDDPGSRFVCVQSVVCDDRNRLWILDPASPNIAGVVPGGPKLVLIDLESGSIGRIYKFEASLTPTTSYLNDVRIDTARGFAYITDSHASAILVLDLESGLARRVLDDHPSTQAEPIVLTVGGSELRRADNSPVRVHADGIALSPEGDWLYYQALTGRTMYRVSTEALRDASRSPQALAGLVEKVAESGASDGLLMDPAGRIYVSAIEKDAILRMLPSGEIETLIQTPSIAWPDTFARGPDGAIYFTTSRIHEGGDPKDSYKIYRIRPGLPTK